MVNRGVSPIDASSVTGQLRLIVGDVASTPLEPAEPGYASYAVWSDDSLAVALLQAGDDLNRAAGSLYVQLAAQYAQQGRSIRTDDLQLDTKSRSSDLLAIARYFFEQADLAEQGNDFFQIVPFHGNHTAGIWPEATPRPHTPTLPTPPAPQPEPTGFGW